MTTHLQPPTTQMSGHDLQVRRAGPANAESVIRSLTWENESDKCICSFTPPCCRPRLPGEHRTPVSPAALLATLVHLTD